MRRFVPAFLLALLCLLPTSLYASKIGDAEDALRHRQYDRAIQLYSALATQGDPEAMLGMGRIYREGLGVEPDSIKSKEWIHKAVNIWGPQAKAGDPYAYRSLALLFHKGIGFPPDPQRANTYFLSAYNLAKPLAHKGDAKAQYLIGLSYWTGRGAKRNHQLALDWFARAGENGNRKPIQHLIYIYESNCCGLQNDAKAEYWRGKLASTNN